MHRRQAEMGLTKVLIMCITWNVTKRRICFAQSHPGLSEESSPTLSSIARPKNKYKRAIERVKFILGLLAILQGDIADQVALATPGSACRIPRNAGVDRRPKCGGWVEYGYEGRILFATGNKFRVLKWEGICWEWYISLMSRIGSQVKEGVNERSGLKGEVTPDSMKPVVRCREVKLVSRDWKL